MGSLTLANFRVELDYLLENRGIADARLSRWINRAYEHISYPTIHKHWELEATTNIPLVTDQFVYSLDIAETYVQRELLGIRSARYVEDTSDSMTSRRQVMQARSLGWFNRRQHTTTAAGPSYYGIFHKQLYISPGPMADINGNWMVLEGWEQPAILTLDADQTVLLGWWDEVILVGAKWMAELELGFLEYAEQTKQSYSSLLTQAPNRELVGADDNETFFPDMEQGNEGIMPR